MLRRKRTSEASEEDLLASQRLVESAWLTCREVHYRLLYKQNIKPSKLGHAREDK